MALRRSKEDVTAKLLATFKQLISEGTLAPGARLPAEREMASSLRVSRGSLRQVLKMLEIMGVVSQRVGDGTYLNAPAPSILAEPMELLILLDGISFEELMDARLIVEPELAARAAARATPEHLIVLRDALSGMEESGNTHARFIEEDLRFHRSIFEMADNRVCSIMFSIVHESLHKLMRVTSQMVDHGHTLKLHRRIYAAIRKQDPGEARAQMFAHLTDAKQLLRRANEVQANGNLEARFSTLAIRTFAAGRPRKATRGPGKQHPEA